VGIDVFSKYTVAGEDEADELYVSSSEQQTSHSSR
jgi:hypothetical protein